jgi:hypothetical protein
VTTPAEDPAAYESYYCPEKIEGLLKEIKDEMIVEEMGEEMFGNENNSIMKVKLRMKRCSTVKIYSTVTRYSTVKRYSTDFLFEGPGSFRHHSRCATGLCRSPDSQAAAPRPAGNRIGHTVRSRPSRPLGWG